MGQNPIRGDRFILDHLCSLLHEISGDYYRVTPEGNIARHRRTPDGGMSSEPDSIWTREKAISALKGNCAKYSVLVGKALSFLQTYGL